jgi:hypothetical protein
VRRWRVSESRVLLLLPVPKFSTRGRAVGGRSDRESLAERWSRARLAIWIGSLLSPLLGDVAIALCACRSLVRLS